MDAAPASPGAPPRKRLLDLLARATGEELRNFLSSLGDLPDYSLLRRPETGLIMVRGRMGGGGSPFNLGEATVSRATLRLANGFIGHGYRLGTDRRAAECAALIDALWQTESLRQQVEDRLLSPLEARLKTEAARLAEETAATKVEFFTMVRGED
ncbi:phosphonate C-P lyase system protein PhnG [Rhizobium paknamense]|uniref:Alpha-D-ribose 1-methylphosphonate 5-triphosphate synthase subunit PhnG n=1 Tax=Rhizobium paknamense TaxID=1206817 RepID=A0ABU0IEI4_9HYPH|nr:phosphonate C-P lyase system protein PhnG [Rhizobium paknamense]MDQ0455870.1 alpha-D-ribose 1-methylphosphonate 5-triphosphate synthase subunit PhnG [Rhizobium paknamense]